MKKTATILMVTLMMMILFLNSMAKAATIPSQKDWAFTYKPAKSQSFTIRKVASTKEEAYKMAAKDCFQRLTGGQYPGEAKGLDIIDVCANPKM